MDTPDVAFSIAPYDFTAARRLGQALGISHTLAQVLTRRGLSDPDEARRFLEAEERHPLDAFGGLRDAAARLLGHVRDGRRITVHGDYDADGVCSTAILVRVLRTLGARVDWYLPSRGEDGYGLNVRTVERLAARGTEVLVTADCAITSVEEVAAAKAAGIDVIVTDHHTPRADGRLPDAPIVHPRLGGNPCEDLCAAGVAYKVAGALLEAAGLDPALADEDLDLVALATVADVVPLHGENRALVRAGLRALAATRKPGLRALMGVAKVDPSGLDAGSIGFRLAPRINAAGRIARADAALELLLTPDEDRALAVAQELDALNADRRDVETRIRFEAEAMANEYPGAPAYVLAAEGWHPGVIGIVAARIAERHYRPTVLIALDGEEGTGSGRSIPGFDLLAGLDAGADALLRHGGHRAAAGLTIERARVDAFREAFVTHAASVLRPEDLVRTERVDAIVPGDALGLGLAEELGRLEPFGMGNPAVSLLVPAATLEDPRALGEGRHVACTLTSGGSRSKAVRFGDGTTLPPDPVDVAVRMEANRYLGTVEPRVLLRHLRPITARPIELLGEPACFADGVRAELDRLLEPWPPEGAAEALAADPAPTRERRDVRGAGIAGVITDLVATGEPVLVVAAHGPHRRKALGTRIGGFALTCWAALEDDPGLAEPFTHVVALDPPAHRHLHALAAGTPGQGWVHDVWGEPETAYARNVHEWDHALREPLAATFRALRSGGRVVGEPCDRLLAGDGPVPRSPRLAGRCVRVLHELGLVELDRDGIGLEAIHAATRTDLERSVSYRAYTRRLEDGRAWLTTTSRRAA